MVKLRVIHGFRDLEAGVHRKPGEVFEVPEARARVILGAGVAEVIEATDEATKATDQESGEIKPAKERRSKHKKG